MLARELPRRLSACWPQAADYLAGVIMRCNVQRGLYILARCAMHSQVLRPGADREAAGCTAAAAAAATVRHSSHARAVQLHCGFRLASAQDTKGLTG